MASARSTCSARSSDHAIATSFTPRPFKEDSALLAYSLYFLCSLEQEDANAEFLQIGWRLQLKAKFKFCLNKQSLNFQFI